MTSAPSTTASPAQNVSREDDITDSEPTIAASGRIEPLLRDWNDVIRKEQGRKQSYQGYDERARVHQRWHTVIVIFAAICGTAAVLATVLKLAVGKFQPIETLEILCAVAAATAVVLGLIAAFHTQWRLLRFKAEQYRFIKFQFLLDATRWLNTPPYDRQEHLGRTFARLHHQDTEVLKEWAQGISALVMHDPSPDLIPGADLTEDLVRYFRSKRIDYQRGYFERQAHARHAYETTTRLIPSACFFLSIIFTLLLFTIEILEGSLHHVWSEELGHWVILILAVVAVAAPIVGAGVRTFRGAFEFGRNAIRFEGVAILLREIDQELTRTTSPLVAFELLHRAEVALVNENRAWTRLMLEAEWFG